MLDLIAKRFVQRANSVKLRGAKRDRAALEFFCGAAIAIEMTGNKADAKTIAGFAMLNIGTNGALAVEALLSENAAAELAAKQAADKAALETDLSNTA